MDIGYDPILSYVAWSLTHPLTDHDLDNEKNQYAFETDDGIPQNVQTQISVYTGRGLLVESQGPVWFWGTAVEHR